MYITAVALLPSGVRIVILFTIVTTSAGFLAISSGTSSGSLHELYRSSSNHNRIVRRLSNNNRTSALSMSLLDRLQPGAASAPDPSQAKITPIDSMKTYEEAVIQSEESLVVIKAFVPWCRACKGFDVKFRKLNADLLRQEAPVHFYELDVFAVKDVKMLLDIKVAPSVVMFMSGTKVDSFSCGPRRFDLVTEKIASRLSLLEVEGGPRWVVQQEPPPPPQRTSLVKGNREPIYYDSGIEEEEEPRRDL